MVFAGGIFAGYDVSASRAVAFSIRGGYLFSRCPEMDGTVNANGSTELGLFSSFEHATLTDASGNPLEVSFSGWHVRLGILVRAEATP